MSMAPCLTVIRAEKKNGIVFLEEAMGRTCGPDLISSALIQMAQGFLLEKNCGSRMPMGQEFLNLFLVGYEHRAYK